MVTAAGTGPLGAAGAGVVPHVAEAALEARTAAATTASKLAAAVPAAKAPVAVGAGGDALAAAAPRPIATADVATTVVKQEHAREGEPRAAHERRLHWR